MSGRTLPPPLHCLALMWISLTLHGITGTPLAAQAPTAGNKTAKTSQIEKLIFERLPDRVSLAEDIEALERHLVAIETALFDGLLAAARTKDPVAALREETNNLKRVSERLKDEQWELRRRAVELHAEAEEQHEKMGQKIKSRGAARSTYTAILTKLGEMERGAENLLKEIVVVREKAAKLAADAAQHVEAYDDTLDIVGENAARAELLENLKEMRKNWESGTKDPTGREQSSTEALAPFDEGALLVHNYAYDPLSLARIYELGLEGVTEHLEEPYHAYRQRLKQSSDDNAKAVFHEVMESIAAQAKLTHGDISLRQLGDTALRTVCSSLDRYSNYLCEREVRELENLLHDSSKSAGVGMTLIKEEDGFLCYPVAGSPAEVAGIHYGDRLIGIDGETLASLSLVGIAGRVRGRPGTHVTLRLKGTDGKEKRISVERRTIAKESLELRGQVLRIREFSPGLPEELTKVLSTTKDVASLLIDLRNCPGGSLRAAIECAELFLDQGVQVVVERERRPPRQGDVTSPPLAFDKKSHLSSSAKVLRIDNITLEQNRYTGSAAELFIAALVQNNVASSTGEKSYGKCRFQRVFDLQSGGRLEITTGELLPPSNQSWERVGLLPSSSSRSRKIFSTPEPVFSWVEWNKGVHKE